MAAQYFTIQVGNSVVSPIGPDYILQVGDVSKSYFFSRFHHLVPARIREELTPFVYPETDEDREQAARDKLREYRKSMRNLLYGTQKEQSE